MLQHYALQQAVNTRSFTADSYQEEGYLLVYQNDVAESADELIHAFTKDGFVQVSAFFVGEFAAFRLYSVNGGQELFLLDNLYMTVGFGFNANRGDELRLSADEAQGTLYVYVKE